VAAVAASMGLSGCVAVVLVPIAAGVGGANEYSDDIEAALLGKKAPASKQTASLPEKLSPEMQVALREPVPANGSSAKPIVLGAVADEMGPEPAPNADASRQTKLAALTAPDTTIPEAAERSDDNVIEPALDEHQPGDEDDADTSEDATPRTPPAPAAGASTETATPAQPEPEEEPIDITRTYKVRKGETLLGILTAAGLSKTQAADAVEAARTVYDVRELTPGQRLTMIYHPRQADRRMVFDLYAFSIGDDPQGGVTVVRRSDDQFTAKETARSGQGRLVRVRAAFEPEATLFESGVSAGIPANLMMELIRIYSWDVDFERNVRPGDVLDVVFTNAVYAASDAEHGLLYSMITIGGAAYRLYRHEVAPGRFEFFNEFGKSAQKALLRTPVQGAEFSSGFGRRKMSRYGFTRMHRGIDFRAPIGSKIFAAGDGVVEKATFHRGYGYYVKIRHSSGYSTLYAHMQRPRKPLKSGAQVRQGDVIGQVGMTGRTTGPHLHYEIHVNGAQVDPMTVKLASGQSLTGWQLRDFQESRGQLEREIRNLPASTKFARSDRLAW
jgi:murein DD-endopeptidase MepM/ murein hydrolase activator NlpD